MFVLPNAINQKPQRKENITTTTTSVVHNDNSSMWGLGKLKKQKP
ncbi:MULTISPECIES: hypothetical protein [Rodentibacter]|nr:hypothetical protein [Rodentibacter sp. JRC1]